MFSGSKKSVRENNVEFQTDVHESCIFTEPVATSSPNVHKKVEMPNLFENFFQELKHFICDQVTKEKEDLKNELIEEIIKTTKISKISVPPEDVYYNCNEELDNVVDGNKPRKKNEEEIAMPPPNNTLVKKFTRKAVGDSENDLNLRNKKPKEELFPIPKKRATRGRSKTRKESEIVEACKIEPIRTRSSMRLKAQSASTTDQTKVVPSEFSDLETPVGRGHLRKTRHNIATVTPGPNVNAPQTILRRPKMGETAISLTGSPLLVTSEQVAAIPQVTIPLADGRVMSVLAKEGLNPKEFPTMDPQTLTKLKMLHDFLGKL